MGNKVRFIAEDGIDANSLTIVNVATPSLTTDAVNMGFATNASNISSGTLSAGRLPAFTGDAASAAGSSSLVLATVNSTPGSFGSASSVAQITVNAKGLITTISNVTISIPFSALTSTPTTLSGYGITDSLQLGSSNPANLGTSAAGTATTAAHSDHVHHLPNLDDLANVTITTIGSNDIIAWNGSAWVNTPTTSVTVGNASKLATARTVAFTGDASGTNTFDGSTNISTALTLATVNSNTGSFGTATASSQLTVNAKGLITAVSNVTITPAWSSITSTPTTLSGYGITDAVNVSRLGAASGVATLTSGSLLTTSQVPAFTGDATNTAGALALTLATVNSNVGSFGSATATPQLTVNGKGLITAVSTATITPAFSSITSTPTTLAGYGITNGVNTSQLGASSGVATLNSSQLLTTSQVPAFTGDVTNTAGALAMTLANTAVTASTYGSATAAGTFTVNSKGLITAASNVTITPAWSSLTAPTTSNSVTATVNTSQTLLGHFDTSATNDQSLFLLSEDIASTKNATAINKPRILSVSTLAGSTAYPLEVGVQGVRDVFFVDNFGGLNYTGLSTTVNGSGVGGSVNVIAGAGDTVNVGGNITLKSGNATGAGAGSVFITGNNDSAAGAGGGINITAGTSSSGTNGTIAFSTNNVTQMTIGSTGAITLGTSTTVRPSIPKGINTGGQGDSALVAVGDGSTDDYAGFNALSGPQIFIPKPGTNYKLLTNWVPTAQNAFITMSPGVSFSSHTPDFNNFISNEGSPGKLISLDLISNTYGSEWSGLGVGNIFQRASWADANFSTAIVVAVYGSGRASVSGARSWGSNFAGIANASGATAITCEMNPLNLVSGGTAYGNVIASSGPYQIANAEQLDANDSTSQYFDGWYADFHTTRGCITNAIWRANGDGSTNTCQRFLYVAGITASVAEIDIPSFFVAPTITSTVNRINVFGAITGNNPGLSAIGTDSNPSLLFQGKGTGGVILMDGAGAAQLTASTSGLAANKMAFGGALLTGLPIAANPVLEIQGLTNSSTGAALVNWSSTTGRTSSLQFVRSIGNTVGTRGGITASGTTIGYQSYIGDDGANWIESVRLEVDTDGTCSTNNMPGRLVFYTNGGSNAVTERLRIDSSGYASFANGGIKLSGNIAFSTTAPTLSSGFGTSPSIVGNGTATFRINVGTGGTANTGTITLPAAANGWNATIQFFNPSAVNCLHETYITSSSTTSITLTNLLQSSGAATAWPASTVLIISATAY